MGDQGAGCLSSRVWRRAKSGSKGLASGSLLEDRQPGFSLLKSYPTWEGKNMPESTSIGVVGAGTMGSGIAQVFATRRYPVVLCDALSSQLERALSTIKKNLNRDMEKGRVDAAERDRVLANIRTQASLENGDVQSIHWSAERSSNENRCG